MIDPDTPLDQIGWRVRIANTFSQLGLKTVGDVQRVGPQRLLQEPNFGRKSLREVEAEIGPLGDYSRQAHDPALASISSRRLLDELARRLNVPEAHANEETPVREWRAREAAAFALNPIMAREGLEACAAGALVEAAVSTYLRVVSEPLPEGWKRYVKLPDD